MNTYKEHRMNVMALNKLPTGTVIYFYKNGKERYLKKILPNKMYKYPWYSAETGYSFPSERIPSDWRIMATPHHTINNAQKVMTTRDKFRARFRY